MESNWGDDSTAAARRALDVVGSDRRRVGHRIASETWWAAPAQGLGAALLVAGPAAGFAWAWVLFTVSTGVFVGVEMYFRRRSGLTISRPAGPLGLVVVIAIAVVMVGSLGLNVVLAILGLTGAVLVVAAVVGVVTALGVVVYDRTYVAELRRAR